VKWLDAPQTHDYAAAADYLTLLLDPAAAQDIADRLARAEDASFKAKDIFRASRLPLLERKDSYVARDTKAIEDAKPLSPILLVRPLTSAEPLVIADGYHRLCAVYHFDEDAEIPCRIVDQADSDHMRYEHT
jgi:hypothetical protein